MDYYALGDMQYVVSHYGVPGMHWGIRRYQPYSVGYQRKGGKNGKERIKASSSPIVMKKGTEFQRVTNKDEAERLKKGKINHRIYVSNNDADNVRYLYSAENLPSSPGKSKEMAVVTMASKKDMKVMSSKQLTDDLLDRYGSQPVSSISAPSAVTLWFVAKNHGKTIKEAIDAMSENKHYVKKNAEGEKTYTWLGNSVMRDFAANTIGSRVEWNEQVSRLKKYKKMGYDAIADLEDISQGVKSPMIILDPKTSIKYLSTSSIEEGKNRLKDKYGVEYWM